jgi:integrase
MGLEIQKKKDGSLRSKWWYGRFEVNGKETCVNLDVEIKGTVPKKPQKYGDTAFECSRTLAAAKLKDLMTDAHSRKTAAHHLQELYEIKAGETLTQISLDEMADRWEFLPIKRKRKPAQVKVQKANIEQFHSFVSEKYPQVKELSQVTRKMALAWLKSLNEKKMSGQSYNVKLAVMRFLFDRLGPEAGVISNPFAGIPYQTLNTVHRQPFTQKELNAILTHCDELTRPVVLTAMCTAMRRGDCCMLKWESVDLEHSFISVKTSKTGELAEIPLFPVLRAELERLTRKSIYVFPEAAAMYKKNHHGLSWRFQKALKAAGIEGTQVERDDAMQKASVKDFHSLRTTWITMALSAGVPMELVRRVTGHSTVEVVLKHYFRPGREAFRTALETAMPKMLTGGTEERLDLPKEVLELGTVARALKPEELVEKNEALAKAVARMTKEQRAAAIIAA